MKFRKAPELLCVVTTVAAVLSTFSVSAISAHAVAPSAAEARYQQDRADCLSGKTDESEKTCLKEAGAALQAARQHELKSPGATRVAANERARCDPLSGDDKASCLKRADGVDTSVSGGVAAGGDIKETVTVVPGTADVHPETMPATAAGPRNLPPAPSN